MTPKVTVTIYCRFDLVYDPQGHRVIRGRRDLLYDPNLFNKDKENRTMNFNSQYLVLFKASAHSFKRLLHGF